MTKTYVLKKKILVTLVAEGFLSDVNDSLIAHI